MSQTTTRAWSCLSIEGPDSRSFLQGQLSNDIELVSHEQAGFYGLCTPKGRLIANFFIVPQPGGDEQQMLLVLPASVSDQVLQTLAKYIVFSRAELKAAPQWTASAIRSAEAAGLAEPADEALACSMGTDWLCMRYRAGQPDCLLLTQDSFALADEQLILNDKDWALTLIRAGLGLVQEANSDEFVPQMLNMQLNGGISFSKGCYTGQEIIARAQYRGKIKRRMYRAELQSAAVPAIAEAVTDIGSGKALGVVISAARSSSDTVELLAVLSLPEDGSAAPGVDSQPLRLLELPYSIKEA